MKHYPRNVWNLPEWNVISTPDKRKDKDKPIAFFESKKCSLKKCKLDSTGGYAEQTSAAVKASYLVSHRIAKAKKPHTIGEQLVLPPCRDIVSCVLGDENAKKLDKISLSNDIVSRRILDMLNNIKDKVI